MEIYSEGPQVKKFVIKLEDIKDSELGVVELGRLLRETDSWVSLDINGKIKSVDFLDVRSK
jgi:hypothetical protein